MDERANLISKVTDEATKKAKSEKLNAAQTKLYIDEEVKKIIDKAYQTAKYILREHAEKLNIVAGILLEKEKIDGDEFDAIFN